MDNAFEWAILTFFGEVALVVGAIIALIADIL